MIPIHHGAFALSYEKLSDPRRWLSELVRQRELEGFVMDLEPGQSRVFVPPRSRTLTDDGIPDADWDDGEVAAGGAASEVDDTVETEPPRHTSEPGETGGPPESPPGAGDDDAATGDDEPDSGRRPSLVAGAEPRRPDVDLAAHHDIEDDDDFELPLTVSGFAPHPAV